MSGYDLKLERTFDASAHEVFRRFTEPELLEGWYRPVPGWTTSVESIDLRVGGRYSISFGPTPDETFHEKGEYLEIVPGQRLVYTLDFEGLSDSFHTVVTVEMFEEGDGTRVVITEVGYPSEQIRDHHASGWGRFLDGLEEQLRA